MLRPAIEAPLAPVTVTMSCRVWPIGTLSCAGATTTRVAFSSTLRVAAADRPSTVALRPAPPACTAVTIPLVSMVAMSGNNDSYLIGRPVSSTPFASLRTTVV